MEIHLNTRKNGTQTPLSDSEKKYLSDLLGGKYKIGSPLGRSGASTSAFLITDASGKEFVLRIPNKPDDIEHWLETEKKQFANQEKYLAGYQGNISIPKTLEYQDFFTIQEKGAGEPFADYIYDGLSREKQLKLAQDFAAFLKHSHQKNANRTTTRPVSLDGGQDFTLNEHVKSVYKSVMTPDEYKWFCGLLDEFNNRDTSDEFLTFAFNDFRYSNILYDTKSGQLSVIDFGACLENSVYMDFVPYCADSFGISYKFLQDVINSYNNIKSDSAKTIKINPRKVALFHILGILAEIAGVNKEPEQLKRVLYMPQRLGYIKQLCTLFGVENGLPPPEKKTKFEKGKVQIKEKLKNIINAIVNNNQNT